MNSVVGGGSAKVWFVEHRGKILENSGTAVLTRSCCVMNETDCWNASEFDFFSPKKETPNTFFPHIKDIATHKFFKQV